MMYTLFLKKVHYRKNIELSNHLKWQCIGKYRKPLNGLYRSAKSILEELNIKRPLSIVLIAL